MSAMSPAVLVAVRDRLELLKSADYFDYPESHYVKQIERAQAAYEEFKLNNAQRLAAIAQLEAAIERHEAAQACRHSG